MLHCREIKMRQEIESLLQLTDILSWRDKIESIGHELPLDYDKAFENLLDLDRRIPGLGQHNINKKVSEGHYTGVYCIEDRPIFRGIQYVGMHLDTQNPEWFTRMIVIESCYHIESSLKRKTDIHGHLSIGVSSIGFEAKKELARLEGFEPSTLGSEDRCSVR